MHESDFHTLAEQTLGYLQDTLEPYDANGALEVDSMPGILTVTHKNGKQHVISKHVPSQQVWVASPVSGGLHFTYRDGAWKLPDDRTLVAILSDELGVKL